MNKLKLFLAECLTIGGLSFIMGALLISAIEAGQWQERRLLEQVCQVNGSISINDVTYKCEVQDEQESENG